MSELTSKLTIGELPNEVIIKVFRYLDQHNLKNATLTCKHWCNLIESSCQWSINLNASAAGRLDSMLTTNRKFGTIELFRMQRLEKKKIRKIFKRHGVNVVKLRFISCRIASYNLFARLLKFMPNLKQVYMYEMTSDTVAPEQYLPELKKLKSLEMNSCDASFLKCFEKAKLTTLNLSYCKQPLSLLGESPNNYKVLVKFLEAQGKTLKELDIANSFPSFVYVLVFASMIKLNTLTLRMNNMPLDMAFYERLEENRSITKLTFDDSVCIDELFPNFLKKLPNIHTVIALGQYATGHRLPVIAQALSKLESLATNVFSGRSFSDVRLPNLKILEIRDLWGKVDWNKFMKAHAQLTELTIETIHDKSYLNSFDIDQIMSNVSLQSLRLGVGFTADKWFFNNIRNKCPGLKMLHLHKSCMPDTLKDNIDYKVLRFCGIITS